MVIEWIVQQHAEEAAFVWTLRNAATCSPNYQLYELANLDNRVEAHLDGLRVNGEPGWEHCRRQLEAIGQTGEVFAAAVLAFENGTKERVQPVLEIAASAPELEQGMVSAMGWISGKSLAKECAAGGSGGAAQAAVGGHRRAGSGTGGESSG
jgi:uncharacterized protein (TIGR02270 family)